MLIYQQSLNTMSTFTQKKHYNFGNTNYTINEKGSKKPLNTTKSTDSEWKVVGNPNHSKGFQKKHNENNNTGGFHKKHERTYVDKIPNNHHVHVRKVLSIPDDGISMSNWISRLDNRESPEQVTNEANYAKNKIDNRIWDLVSVMKEMIRNHKYVVIDGLLQIIDCSKLEELKYKPHNENVWIGKQDPNSVSSEDIIRTFNVLIKHFSFTDLSENSIDGNNKLEVETMSRVPGAFYTSVIRRDKRIPGEVQNNLFIYMKNTLGCKTSESFASEVDSKPEIMTNIRQIINEYFNSDKPMKKRFETAESFFGALLNTSNKILPNVREECYHYFTHEYYDLQEFTSSLRKIINKITEKNSPLFRDFMLFMMTRDLDSITLEFFNSIVSREYTGPNEHIAFDIMISEPTDKIDFGKYFSTIDLKNYQQNFVEKILTNYNTWIENIIQGQKYRNPDVDDNDFRTNDLAVVMMMFGIAYSKGYMEIPIIEEMINIVKNKTNIVKGFEIFLDTSKIDLSNLKPLEYELLKQFLLVHYVDKIGKDVFNIETFIGKMLYKDYGKINIRSNNIKLFLETGTFLNISNKTKILEFKTNKLEIKTNKLQIKTNKVKKNPNNMTKPIAKTVGRFGNLDSYESDDEEVLNKNELDETKKVNIDLESFENIETPKPNKKVINCINTFLKFKGNEHGLIDAIDEVLYSIETNKISVEEYAYGFIHCLSESKLTDIFHLKKLMESISNSDSNNQILIGYNGDTLVNQMKIVYNINPELIENCSCDNPKFIEIFNQLVGII